MGKPSWTCKELVDYFLATLDTEAKDYDEVHLIFDCNDISNSLKEATRGRYPSAKPAYVCQVEDNTPIANVSLKQFLSSKKTKDHLKVYLAYKSFCYCDIISQTFIVTPWQDVSSNR